MSMVAGTPPRVGDLVGDFTLDQRLGAGGNATVYAARSATGETVALKILHPGQLSEEDLARFEREYRALSLIDHPHIVKVFETGEADGHRWLAMEYVDGTDLGTCAEGWEADPPESRWELVEAIFRGLCEALAYLHNKGIIHLDIKPSNVRVTSDGRAKLMDFGVVKAPDVFSTALTVAGRLVGTIAFMAPEQITGEPVDTRADLYSLGAVLYILLTGRRPIVADSIAAYLAQQISQEPRRPGLVDPEVPAYLDRIAVRLLRKSPDERFQSATEVLEALQTREGGHRPPLHERDAILSQVRQKVSGLRQGESGVIGLLGERGSGRSSLLREVAELSEMPGVSIQTLDHEGSIDDFQQGRPTEGAWLVLADDLDRMPEWEARKLPRLLDDPDTPLLLVFSATSSGSDMEVQHLAVADLLSLSNARTIPVPPLARSGTISMIRDYGLSATISALLGKRLVEELGGLPGLVEEQLDALLAAGWLIAREESGYRPGVPIDQLRSSPLPLPEGVRMEFEQRLGGLQREEREQLELLAILGGQASSDLLARLAPMARDRLDPMVHSGLLRIHSDGLHEMVSLSSPRFCQVLLERLELEDQKKLHLEVAEALLSQNPRRIGSVAEAAAQHFLKAGEKKRAWPLLVKAAIRSARRHRFQQVLHLTRSALNAFEECGETLDENNASLFRTAIALRGEAFLERGQHVDAKEVLNRVAWADQTEALATAARVALASAMVELGEGEEAAEILNQVLGDIQPGDPTRFRALRSLGRSQCLLGLFEEAQNTWELGWTAAREQTSPEQEGLCLLGLGETLIARGRLAEARTILQRAESRLRGSNRVELAGCLVALGELDLLDGYYRKALARAEDANAIAQQAEDLVLSVRSLELCSLALASVGMDRDAERLASEAEGLRRAREAEAPLPSPRVPSPQDAARLDFFTALEHEGKGQLDEAAHHLQSAVARLPSEGCRGLELQLQSAISRVTGSPESKSRATALAISVMDTLPPELAAAFSARDELSHFFG